MELFKNNDGVRVESNLTLTLVKLVNLLIAQSQKKFCEVSYAVINLGLSFDCECIFLFCTAEKAKTEIRKY